MKNQNLIFRTFSALIEAGRRTKKIRTLGQKRLPQFLKSENFQREKLLLRTIFYDNHFCDT